MADFLTTALGTSEVAHALKAPLITMEKALSLLRDPSTGALTETQQKFLTIAERNLQLVIRALGEFLDSAKLDAGTMRLIRKPAPVEALAQQIADETRAAASAKGVTLAVQPAAGIPPAAFDPARMAQAVALLVQHAVAMTPSGGTVTLAVAARGAWVDLRITHPWPELRAEEADHLFDRRLPTSAKADAGGLALGLPLAKGLIELHQGRVTVAGAGGTATWTLSLPVDRGGMGPTKILLVDDEADFRETMAFWLRSRGHEVREVDSGDKVVAALRQDPANVVFLDIHLPPTDGLDVLTQIRAAMPTLPVIMVTAHPDSQQMATARGLGISGYFPKGGGLQDLVALMDVALRRHKGL